MRKKGIYIVLMLILAGCDEKVDWPLQNRSNDFIVVDGIITDELKTQSVTITRPVVYMNEIPAVVSGAEVIVSGNSKVYHFSEKPGLPGKYYSDIEFAGKVGKEYSLLINFENSVYTAKASMLNGIDNFVTAKFIRDKNTKLFHINWASNPYAPLRPAMFELLLDWSKVPGYLNADSASTHARLLYYSLPTLDVSEVLSPAMETVNFPAGTIITERRYSLSAEHAAFIRALLSETSWQGGLFNSATANVPTNMSAGAVGFFGACEVNVKTEVVL